MKNLGNNFTTFFAHEGKIYVLSHEEGLKIGDVFFDWRSDVYKKIENEEDVRAMSFVAPECYTILREV